LVADPNKPVKVRMMVSNLFYEIDSLEHDLALATEFGHVMVAWSRGRVVEG